MLLFLSKTQKPLNSDTLQFRKNDVTEPKDSLITSKGQFQQLFANKFVQK